jgi:hypothetical protein
MDMCPSKNKDAPTQQQLVRKKERENGKRRRWEMG